MKQLERLIAFVQLFRTKCRVWVKIEHSFTNVFFKKDDLKKMDEDRNKLEALKSDLKQTTTLPLRLPKPAL